MELPDDVLRIIKEYSKPVTRPDWRTLQKMPLSLYKREVMIIISERQNMPFERYIRLNRIFTLCRYYDLFDWDSWVHNNLR